MITQNFVKFFKINIIIIQMSNFSSGRPSILKSSRYLKGRQSNSPTQSSSQSDKSLWARSYKNQPIPAQLRKRLIGKKYQFYYDSDEDEQIMAVEQQQQQQQIQKIQNKKTRLSKFKVISDKGEFSDSRRSRINSERKLNRSPQRCHSVTSLKLPQVLQEKREEDELRRRGLGLSKFSQFKDKNEFGEKRKRRSSSDYLQVVSHAESMELPTQLSQALPQQILENEAEQTKSLKLAKQKSMITVELQKLIVDEVDQLKKKKEEYKQEIQTIIEEEKPEEEVDTQKLSHLLTKFQNQSSYLTKLNDEQDFSKKMDPSPIQNAQNKY